MRYSPVFASRPSSMVRKARHAPGPPGSRNVSERTEHIRRLAELIKDVRIAMLTTFFRWPAGQPAAGHPGSRFKACVGSPPAPTARRSPRSRPTPFVNVSYASGEHVRVGVGPRRGARRSREGRSRRPAMALFFPNGKDDPNLRLIRVQADTAEYWDGPGTILGKALHFIVDRGHRRSREPVGERVDRPALTRVRRFAADPPRSLRRDPCCATPTPRLRESAAELQKLSA